MKINYYTIINEYYDKFGDYYDREIAHFSTKEKAQAYLNNIETKIKSKWLKIHYDAIETATEWMEHIEKKGRVCTYQIWLNEYNDQMRCNISRAYDSTYRIVNVSIDVDIEPEIDFI